MTQLQIIDDKKQITEKKSVISACNVDYRLKRSGPKFGQIGLNTKKIIIGQKVVRTPFYKNIASRFLPIYLYIHTYIYNVYVHARQMSVQCMYT